MINVVFEHVEFYSKNKFEKLVHLVGPFIRIYHVEQLSERHICKYNVNIGLCMCTVS